MKMNKKLNVLTIALIGFQATDCSEYISGLDGTLKDTADDRPFESAMHQRDLLASRQAFSQAATPDGVFTNQTQEGLQYQQEFNHGGLNIEEGSTSLPFNIDYMNLSDGSTASAESASAASSALTMPTNQLRQRSPERSRVVAASAAVPAGAKSAGVTISMEDMDEATADRAIVDIQQNNPGLYIRKKALGNNRFSVYATSSPDEDPEAAAANIRQKMRGYFPKKR